MADKKLYFFTLEWLSYEMSSMGTGRINNRNERLLICENIQQAIKIANKVVPENVEYTIKLDSKNNTEVCYGKKED